MLEHRREVAAGDLADHARRRASTGYPSRGIWRPSTRGRAAGGRCRAPAPPRAAARPRKSPLSKRTTQPSPAWSGVIPGPSSWPWSGSPASSRSVSRAPSPAGRDPGVEQRPPHRRRRRAGHVQLDAVLAGVAGAGDPAARRRRTRAARTAKRGDRAPRRARPRPAAPAPRVPAPRARRASAVTSSIVHSPAPWTAAASPSASTSGAVFDAFGITRKSPGATHHTMMSSTTCASSGSRRWVYCARPGRCGRGRW